MKIFFSLVALVVVAVLVVYGTLSPCGILKRVIASEAGKNGGAGIYAVFGGFIERGVDTLNTVQCVEGIYKVKTEGVDATLNSLLK